MRLNSILVFSLILSGCTSIATSLESKPVPTARLFLKAQKREKDIAEVVIIRDRSFAGSACYYAIYVDDNLAAKIGAAERAEIKLDTGERRIKVTRDTQASGLCSLGDDMTEQKVVLMGSDKKYFRLSMTFSGWPQLESIQAPVEKL